MLTYTSLPYSGFDLLNQCPLQTAQDRQHCAEKNLQVAKLAMKQKTFDLYRLVTGFARGAENSNNLQNCFMNVAELLEMCRKIHRVSVLCLFLEFSAVLT